MKHRRLSKSLHFNESYIRNGIRCTAIRHNALQVSLTTANLRYRINGYIRLERQECTGHCMIKFDLEDSLERVVHFNMGPYQAILKFLALRFIKLKEALNPVSKFR